MKMIAMAASAAMLLGTAVSAHAQVPATGTSAASPPGSVAPNTLPGLSATQPGLGTALPGTLPTGIGIGSEPGLPGAFGISPAVPSVPPSLSTVTPTVPSAATATGTGSRCATLAAPTGTVGQLLEGEAGTCQSSCTGVC
ncbi:MAG TPA: hypothetical protein VM689_22810 [Aliidongia sp.]|nr:hypothetical protein [Aliidongia sp.]